MQRVLTTLLLSLFGLASAAPGHALQGGAIQEFSTRLAEMRRADASRLSGASTAELLLPVAGREREALAAISESYRSEQNPPFRRFLIEAASDLVRAPSDELARTAVQFFEESYPGADARLRSDINIALHSVAHPDAARALLRIGRAELDVGLKRISYEGAGLVGKSSGHAREVGDALAAAYALETIEGRLGILMGSYLVQNHSFLRGVIDSERDPVLRSNALVFWANDATPDRILDVAKGLLRDPQLDHKTATVALTVLAGVSQSETRQVIETALQNREAAHRRAVVLVAPLLGAQFAKAKVWAIANDRSEEPRIRSAALHAIFHAGEAFWDMSAFERLVDKRHPSSVRAAAVFAHTIASATNREAPAPRRSHTLVERAMVDRDRSVAAAAYLASLHLGTAASLLRAARVPTSDAMLDALYMTAVKAGAVYHKNDRASFVDLARRSDADAALSNQIGRLDLPPPNVTVLEWLSGSPVATELVREVSEEARLQGSEPYWADPYLHLYAFAYLRTVLGDGW